MKQLFILMCVASLTACATPTAMPVWETNPSAPTPSYSVTRLTPAPAPAYSGAEIGAMEIERVPFRAGVSSTTVEKMAAQYGCSGATSQGAGLMTPQGPVEIYRMVCDSNRVFMARCEFRQCRPLSVTPAGGYAVPVQGMAYANRGQLGQREVPQLSINWGCRDCAANERVPALISAAYARAAMAAGYKVSGMETANVSIVEFAERQPALRMMFGKFAGLDRMSTQTTFRGQRMLAQDTATESTMSIETVSERIGAQTFRNLTPKAR